MVVLIEDRQHFGCNESRLGEDWKHMLLYNVQYLKGLGIFHEVILTVKFNCTFMKLSGELENKIFKWEPSMNL